MTAERVGLGHIRRDPLKPCLGPPHCGSPWRALGVCSSPVWVSLPRTARGAGTWHCSHTSSRPGMQQQQAEASHTGLQPNTLHFAGAAWEDAIPQGAQHPSPAVQPVSPGWGHCLHHPAQDRDLPCPVFSLTSAQSMCQGWQASSPPATSCPGSAWPPVIFHLACELCPSPRAPARCAPASL